MSTFYLIVAAICLTAPLAAADLAAKADGVTDDTAAIQAAIDLAAAKGGQVYLPPGKYLVKGSLHVKPGVAVVGAAVAPQYIKPLLGTVILATGGRDKEDAAALFELGDSSAVQGLTVFYPDQKPTDIHPYSWTFHLQGGDNTVENVTLINSYNAIRVGPEGNVRHRIRSVYGCALRRGILVDACTDIGRVENVQFHCHWWSAPEVGGDWGPVFEYMWKNCEAFTFGRTDWEYITNNVVLSHAVHPESPDGITVDTHVSRLAIRMALTPKPKTKAIDADKIEADLMALIPREQWVKFGDTMIWHGRQVCTAKKAWCERCVVEELCPKVGVGKGRASHAAGRT